MNPHGNLPEHIFDAVCFIKEAGEQKYLTRADKDNLNRAKLKVAFWALRQENLAPSRENLSYILGVDAAEIMGGYDRYLERESDKAAAARNTGADDRKKSKPEFWENA